MPFPDTRALVFDYGNTLIEFNAPQIAACDAALGEALLRTHGPFDAERLAAVRKRDRLAPYQGTEYRENDLPAITRALVRELYGCDCAPEALEELLAVRRRAFVEAVTAPEGLHELLERLSRRYTLALLSNYPCGLAIRGSLERLGLERYLSCVVVSADVGRVKPHPEPFRRVCSAIGVAPDQACYVGDNWLADVQGSKRAGMRAIWYRRYDPAEWFAPAEGDHEPDRVIHELEELLG